MKIALCQVNTTPGDFDGNAQKILHLMEQGMRDKADMIVFPELTIPGYLCRDMMFRKGFVAQNLATLRKIENHYRHLEPDTSSPKVVLGYIDYNRTGCGKPFRNMAAVIGPGGIVLGTYAKQLLPFYDVFDEGRYFEPGTELLVFEAAERRWGVCICEDVWNDKGSEYYNHHSNPISKYLDIGIQNIVSINSSPYLRGKPAARVKMLHKSMLRLSCLVYVNQTGGQDELVFDGNSIVFVNRDCVYGCGATESYCLYDPGHQGDYYTQAENRLTKDESLIVKNMLVDGLRDYITKSGFKSVVVSSSGGIDSAVVLVLACEAIGPQNVHAIRQPSMFSSDGSKNDAFALHKNLGCHDYLVPVDHMPAVNHLTESLRRTAGRFTALFQNKEYNPVADENIQARIRGSNAMWFSNATGSLLLTTGNKTELALGYCTLYGDMNGGFAPISDLYKMEVYALANYINKDKEIIPERIIKKAPSAELAPGQTDEASLLPYPILDNIVRGYIEDHIGDFEAFKEYAHKRGYQEDGRVCLDVSEEYPVTPTTEWVKGDDACLDYERMIRMIDRNEFKRRQAAPGIKVSRVAFGTGRRLPIVKK